MGSSSIGGQGFTFGLSIGTTWTDSNCQRLKNSRQLQALGYQRAAVALVCVDDDVRAAMLAAGTPCPGSTEERSAYVAPAPVVIPAPASPATPEVAAEAPPVQEWKTSMAPVPDPVRQQRKAKKRKLKEMPPK